MTLRLVRRVGVFVRRPGAWAGTLQPREAAEGVVWSQTNYGKRAERALCGLAKSTDVIV